MDRYTDEYFAQKQIIAVSRLKTVAVDRSLGITPENLTVEIIDKNQ